MHHHHRIALSSLILTILLSGYVIFVTIYGSNKPEPVIALPFNGVTPTEIYKGDTSKKQVIFTFDGGEGNQSVEQILSTLKKHHVKGTFFLTGKWVLRNPDMSRKILSEGNEIFNHTYNHPHLTQNHGTEVVSELTKMDAVLFDIVGTSSKPYFRPPYGDTDSKVLRLAGLAGFRSVMWTVDAHDWMENQGTTAEEVKERILSSLAPGTIYLMHLGDTITGKILDEVFTTVENRGYQIVSLTQGL